MGSFCVERVSEAVEAFLLGEAVAGWRSRGFLFEGQMHAFVLTVLLRMSGLDALDGDAEPEPPDGEFGEIGEAVRAGEREAVIASDDAWQSVLGEQAREGGDHGRLAG